MMKYNTLSGKMYILLVLGTASCHTFSIDIDLRRFLNFQMMTWKIVAKRKIQSDMSREFERNLGFVE
jgi:hypothetical protein